MRSPRIPSLATTLRRLVGAAFFTMACMASHAQSEPMTKESNPLQNVAHLNATATVEVANDVLSIAFTTTKEGTDAQVVQTGLKQALDAALTEAKKIAKAGQVDVQTGGFALYPRYNNKGVINGWTGSTELVVTGKDMQAVAQLTGRVQTMTIARVAHGLSREAREKVEGEASEKAITRFRARASELARQFGFANYALREVHVTLNEPTQHAPMMQARGAGGAADMALPTEPGKGNVTAMVNGSIQMK